MENTSNRAVVDETPNWPQLLSKTVDDLTRIAQTEIELLESKARILLESQVDKIAGMLFLIVALSYGSLFLLGGVVLLIHLWLAWWLSFLITGAAIVLAGIIFKLSMTATGRRKAA